MTDELPPDPWEVSHEEVAERLAHIENATVRQLLEELWRRAPRAELSLRALHDMPSMGALYAGIDAMAENELRSQLFLLLYGAHRHRLSPEAFDRWTIPPDWWPDGEDEQDS